MAGDGGREAATRALKTSVEDFNAALSHYGHGVGFKTAESVEGTPPNQTPLTLKKSKLYSTRPT